MRKTSAKRRPRSTSSAPGGTTAGVEGNAINYRRVPDAEQQELAVRREQARAEWEARELADDEVRCPECQRPVRVKGNGVMRSHSARKKAQRGRAPCAGWVKDQEVRREWTNGSRRPIVLEIWRWMYANRIVSWSPFVDDNGDDEV